MNTILTKRDLIERGIDALPPPSPTLTVQHQPSSGVSQVNLPQVVEVAKFMAAAGEGVPQHCRGNVGICLRIVFQSVEWAMSPFSVADMSYIVNGRLAYMSQLLHAVVEARAPLQHRLECAYDGEAEQRTCTVRGIFITGDLREYTTPPIGKIKVKNSPLWSSDPDQQLFYFASRSWARKWAPDVLLGVYTKEELIRDPNIDREEDTAPGLHARLVGSPTSAEGHRPGHVEAELEQVAPASRKAIEAASEPEAVQEPPAPKKRARGRARAEAREAAPEPAVAALQQEPPPEDAQVPKTPAEYVAYASAWIKACDDLGALNGRWKSERALRNAIGVTQDDRMPLDELMEARRSELGG